MSHNEIYDKQRAWLCNLELLYFLSNHNKGINPFSLELTWRYSSHINLSKYSYTDIKPKYPKAIWSTISTITLSVHSSYKDPDVSTENLIDSIVEQLKKRPVSNNDMQINKSTLANKPRLMTLIMLMQDMVIYKEYYRLKKQLIWLSIALHTSVLQMYYKSYSVKKDILMQFKLAQFSESANRAWIWESLPSTSELSMNTESILLVLSNILEQKEDEIKSFENSDAISLIESENSKSPLNIRLGQIQKIYLSYQDVFFLKASSKKLRKNKNKDNNDSKKKVKAISLAQVSPVYEPSNNEPDPYYWDTTPDDIEKYIPKLDTNFFEAEIEKHDGLETSFEEKIDHYDRPYISYSRLPDPLLNHSVPLQAIDITLQQNHMSQRDLNLNSNTRLLSLAGYQSLFSTLSYDAKSDANESEKSAASLLLLSMLTGLPIKSLIKPEYIGHPSIFHTLKNKAYIRHQLGVTKRSKKFDAEIFENEFDEVKMPLPLWLVEYLSSNELPEKEALTNYLSKLRASLQLPYLSINRIETTLHVVLSRYTPNCHSHIADIICRVPASHAPAMYYSSHTSEELITHYKAALNKLNINKSFDLSYITAWHKYTLGSAFAFKPDYVRKFIADLQAWVKHSPNADTHFDRTSILVWFIFCILTGVRPNNGIGTISDIDLETGWLLVYDKPSKNVQNHRLVPLCSTLIRYLTHYKAYLIDYQLRHPLKHKISECVDEIRLGEDVALLRLLSDSADCLKDIKRGDAYQMTHEVLDANPYWTRHFVRTQLEKYGVNLVLINTVIGHERGRQEALGQLSSSSKSKIKSVGGILESIAISLDIKTLNDTSLHYYGVPNNA